MGAGAPHAATRQEKEEQIDRDIPRILFNIGGKTLGGSQTDPQKDIQSKLVSLSGHWS